MRAPGPLLAVVLWAASLTAACSRKGAETRGASIPPDLGPVVARVGESSIYAAEVKAQADRMGASAAEALEELVRFHVLAARAKGLGPPPDHILKSAAVQRLMERELEPTLTSESIPEPELRALYERGRDRYVHGRLVEIAVLAVYTGPRMKPEPRARARESARALAEHIGTRPVRTPEDFEAIAADPAWRARKVAFRKTLQSEDQPFPPAVGAAVMKLKAVGDTTPLIQDETGYYIARYISEQPPKNVSFEQAAPEIRALYHPIWQQRQFARFATALMAKHGATVLGAGAASSR